MIKITDAEKIFIEENLENGKYLIEEAIKTNTFGDLLADIDAYLVCGERGMDDNYDLTDFGRKAQKVHDDIFFRNHDYDEETDSYIANY